MHIVLYTSGGGRTCDQLMTLAQFVAFTEEFAGEFVAVDIPFWPFAAGFSAFVSNRVCAVPPSGLPRHLAFLLRAAERTTRHSSGRLFTPLGKVRYRLRLELVRWVEGAAGRSQRCTLWIGDTRAEPYRHLRGKRRDFLILDDPEVLADFRRNSVTVICGPKIRCWNLVAKHEAAVRRALGIREDHIARAEEFIGGLRRQYDFLIGVSARQTDYREYAGGRFFFTSSQYAKWMREAQDLYLARGRVGFVVASDEPQDAAVFTGLRVNFSTSCGIAGGRYLEDLAELGMCDLVMTTASSFGCCGAFLGKKPVLPLTRPEVPLHAVRLIPDLLDCTRYPDFQVAIW